MHSSIHSDNISSDWKKSNLWCSSKIYSWSFVVPCLHEDLPKLLIKNVLPILLADDTSVIVTDSNIVDFQLNMKVVFEQLNNWFNVNVLLLKFERNKFRSF